MVKRYVKKPVVIEAVQWNGDNRSEILEFCGIDNCFFCVPTSVDPNPSDMYIRTLEGNMLAKPGDFIIRGVNGEFYPCKPDIFDKTYEAAE